MAGAGGGAATTVVLVAGGVAAAAAAVVGAGALGGGDESGPDRPQPAIYHYELNFGPPPGVDLSVCAPQPNSIVVCCSRISVTEGVPFDTLQPGNSFRLMGQSNATSFTGTLSCVSGAGSGPFTATGNRDGYQGEWTFGAQRGVLTVTRAAAP
jgi:hypothetical protein